MVKINDITSKSPTIKILCDQITFNASDETVVISDAVLDDCSNYLLPSLKHNVSCNDPILSHPPNVKPRIVNSNKKQNVSRYSFDSATRADIGDIICLLVIVILVFIWISVFISYYIKDATYRQWQYLVALVILWSAILNKFNWNAWNIKIEKLIFVCYNVVKRQFKKNHDMFNSTHRDI